MPEQWPPGSPRPLPSGSGPCFNCGDQDIIAGSAKTIESVGTRREVYGVVTCVVRTPAGSGGADAVSFSLSVNTV